MARRGQIVVALVVALVVCAAPAWADVALASVLGEHMVLQQGKTVPVWGTAEAGEAVSVALCGQTAKATAGADGTWKVELAPLKAGGPFEMTVKGKNAIALKNVLVGEVWVCSGQSNMAMSVGRCFNAKEEAAAAKFPQIRLFKVKNVIADKPLDSTEGQWAECSPQTAPGFSGVGFFFGRKLHQELKVPIGLINTSWGGTPAEAWTSRPTLDAAAELKPILDRWDEVKAKYPAALKAYQEGPLKKWEERVAPLRKAVAAAQKAQREAKTPEAKKAAANALRTAQASLRKVRRPRGPRGHESPHRPSSLYNGMIAPLLPMAIQGAIWYQGESNAGRAYQYRLLFPTMIKDWRKSFAQGDVSFYWVQLANFLKIDAEPKADPWPELREAQFMTLALPKTGEAVIIDVGAFNDIHPRNKQTVGLRLALNALAKDYGQKIVCSGPRYDSMKVEGSKVRISLKHVGGGLVAPAFTDPVTPCGPALQKRFGVDDPAAQRPKAQVLGFAVAGEDKVFVWADEAVIEGGCVVVSSSKVAKPVAVRYGWSNNPICNLYNTAGLPACPFRTDDWPCVTADNK